MARGGRCPYEEEEGKEPLTLGSSGTHVAAGCSAGAEVLTSAFLDGHRSPGPSFQSDLFPLPSMFSKEEACDKHARGWSTHHCIGSKVDEVVSCVNALAKARAGRSLSLAHCGGRSPTTGSVTALHEGARERWFNHIKALGKPPSLTVRRGALQSLLKSPDPYDLSLESSRRPYDPNLVRVVRDGGVFPKDLIDVVPESLHDIVLHPERWVLKCDEELRALGDDDYVVPYTDPLLTDRDTLLDLVAKLVRSGVLGFRKKYRSKVGLFTVIKKDGSLRLVVDCRLTNQLHRPPPGVSMATAGAWATIDLSDEFLDRSTWAEAGRPLDIHFGGLDLTDGYYQFKWEEMASFFCLDITVRAGAFNIDRVFDEASLG